MRANFITTFSGWIAALTAIAQRGGGRGACPLLRFQRQAKLVSPTISISAIGSICRPTRKAIASLSTTLLRIARLCECFHRNRASAQGRQKYLLAKTPYRQLQTGQIDRPGPHNLDNVRQIPGAHHDRREIDLDENHKTPAAKQYNLVQLIAKFSGRKAIALAQTQAHRSLSPAAQFEGAQWERCAGPVKILFFLRLCHFGFSCFYSA